MSGRREAWEGLGSGGRQGCCQEGMARKHSQGRELRMRVGAVDQTAADLLCHFFYDRLNSIPMAPGSWRGDAMRLCF